MMKNHPWLAIVLIFFAMTRTCKDITDIPNSDIERWVTPKTDSHILFFRLSQDLKLDTLVAGRIQYRLNKARTVSTEIETLSVSYDWVFRQLLLKTADSLFARFDSQAIRFSYRPLDSLLALFSVNRYRKMLLPGWMVLYFLFDYNMPVVASVFKAIPGVLSASENGILHGDQCRSDIDLTIQERKYIFTFWLIGIDCRAQKKWVVEVIDDEAKLLSETIL